MNQTNKVYFDCFCLLITYTVYVINKQKQSKFSSLSIQSVRLSDLLRILISCFGRMLKGLTSGSMALASKVQGLQALVQLSGLRPWYRPWLHHCCNHTSATEHQAHETYLPENSDGPVQNLGGGGTPAPASPVSYVSFGRKMTIVTWSVQRYHVNNINWRQTPANQQQNTIICQSY